MMNCPVAPMAFMAAMVFSFSFKNAVNALWIPIPEMSRTKMAVREMIDLFSSRTRCSKPLISWAVTVWIH